MDEEVIAAVIPVVKSELGEQTTLGEMLSTVALGERHVEPRHELLATMPTSYQRTLCLNILLNSPNGANFRILPDVASSSKRVNSIFHLDGGGRFQSIGTLAVAKFCKI